MNNHEVRPLTGEEKTNFNLNMQSISEILTDKRKYRKVFYSQASNIVNRSTKILETVREQQGLKSFCIMLADVRKQDIKLKLYSIFGKKRNLPKLTSNGIGAP